MINWVDSVVEVLEKNLPGEYWYHTTISFLINDPEIKYDRDILQVVLVCTREWGFHVLNAKHFIYYEGSMKGVLTWFAINLLSVKYLYLIPCLTLALKFPHSHSSYFTRITSHTRHRSLVSPARPTI